MGGTVESEETIDTPFNTFDTPFNTFSDTLSRDGPERPAGFVRFSAARANLLLN